MSKSVAAFRMNAEGLFDSGRSVYFWTVTFYTLHSDWEAQKLFSDFLRHLRQVTGRGWGGVRVSELHREHGVHFHLLVTERLAVDLVRKVGRCHGIGRVNVKVADKDSARYMAKYLSKSREGALTKSGRKARRWACFGDIVRTRVCDLVNMSPMWVFRREWKLGFTDYQAERILARAWDFGQEALERAWKAVQSGNMQDAIRIAMGKLEKTSRSELVERNPLGEGNWGTRLAIPF